MKVAIKVFETDICFITLIYYMSVGAHYGGQGGNLRELVLLFLRVCLQLRSSGLVAILHTPSCTFFERPGDFFDEQ